MQYTGRCDLTMTFVYANTQACMVCTASHASELCRCRHPELLRLRTAAATGAGLWRRGLPGRAEHIGRRRRERPRRAEQGSSFPRNVV